MPLKAVLALLLAGGLCAQTAHAGTILYVDDDAPAGGDGLSWSTAYRFLQDALTDARDADGSVDEIRVAAGLYQPDSSERFLGGSGDRGATFELVSGASIRGGYAGLAAADPDFRDPAANPTVLTGDLTDNDVPDRPSTWSENSWHIITSRRLDTPTELDGLVITAGFA
ncbi:MAG: hypothetical protein IIC73_06000, partial [Armatimonadetes bacterium]|nr:hypothetical protein [Armatimonadota bacterium]